MYITPSTHQNWIHSLRLMCGFHLLGVYSSLTPNSQTSSLQWQSQSHTCAGSACSREWHQWLSIWIATSYISMKYMHPCSCIFINICLRSSNKPDLIVAQLLIPVLQNRNWFPRWKEIEALLLKLSHCKHIHHKSHLYQVFCHSKLHQCRSQWLAQAVHIPMCFRQSNWSSESAVHEMAFFLTNCWHLHVLPSDQSNSVLLLCLCVSLWTSNIARCCSCSLPCEVLFARFRLAIG